MVACLIEPSSAFLRHPLHHPSSVLMARVEETETSLDQVMSNRNFSIFFASLQFDDSPHFSPDRIVSVLGVKKKDLAEICGLRASKFRQSPTASDVQRALRDLVRVLSAAYVNFEDEQQLIFWFKNCPIAPCAFKTAAELCAQGRAVDVIECITTRRC
jgi:hypothetical protein